MATLLLSAAGAAFGAGFGGTVLGLSGAVIGRAVGATLGQAIDRRIFDQQVMGAGSDVVDQGKIDRLRVMGASEGAAVARLWGRQRLAGQVIWATRFLETVSSETTGGGKGNRPSQSVTINTYRYSISLALALCEGEILRVGRIWADGNEIAPRSLTLRLYRGTADQQPDPKIEAVEGTGRVPAYRGLAYVVIEDLDLTPFGNRVPQLSFEVIRAAKGAQDMSQIIPGVALIPGTGEYALATTPVHYAYSATDKRSANKNSISGRTDFATSLRDLRQDLPGAANLSLVVSWFGNDLRCGSCTIRPKVEQNQYDGAQMPWSVSGIGRLDAAVIPKRDNRPIYGGTPTDQSVIEAIRAIKAAGKAVTFYPFVLMDQLAGNGLADPYGGSEQAALPWRGRITGSMAPGLAGSPDGTATATAELDAFFGSATAAQFSHTTAGVIYTGPDQWRYRRFILHYAHLCAAAGGVDSFLIGSELRGITQLRGANHSFPAVTRLKTLAAEVRAILGPNCKISYAADWSEYFGYQTGGNVYFHLDALWGDSNIDYIGIDNYMPLADWRDGDSHADANWGSIYNLDYLRANIAGGEGFDWYYPDAAAWAAQARQPIADADWGEDWIYRYKDLRGWWQNFHYQRLNGVRAAVPSAWVPGAKPIRFTEYGCAALDKGANEPNKFLDPKSSESGLPRGSNGRRDDVMQLAYYQAMYLHWHDPAQNPVSAVYDGPMLDFAQSHAWAWDTRPFPDFPRNTALWSDGANYAVGHWLNGRTSHQSLADVLAEICQDAGLPAPDLSRCAGLVRGYAVQDVTTARAMLQPLLMANAQEVVERQGQLRFLARNARDIADLDSSSLVRSDQLDGILETTRGAVLDQTGRLRLGYVEAEGSFAATITEAIFPDHAPLTLAQSDLPLVLTQAEAGEIAQRWMAESRVARDSARFALPRSRLDLGAGDLVRLDGQTYRIDRIDQAQYQMIEAVRIEAAPYRPAILTTEPRPWVPPLTDAPVAVQFLDLPLMTGEEVPQAPHLAVIAQPWRGQVAVWSAVSDDDFTLNAVVSQCATSGSSETTLAAAPPGLWDRKNTLRVKLATGSLSSASALQVLGGANTAAIGDGRPDFWEIIQFSEAVLVGENTYELRHLLRGQAGSDGVMPAQWPVGSRFVLITAALEQITLPLSARGLIRNYRIGRASAGYDAAEVVAQSAAFAGNGLRPYPVAHLRAKRLGADLSITWIRRSRVNGDSWDGVDVDLGETSETYTLRIYKANVLKREVVLGSAAYVYPAALQMEDGASGAISISVAQRSDSFGNGPFRTIAA